MSGEDVEFDADGVTLRGWFYTAQGTDSPVPAVVMAHGLSGVKEMHLDDFAEVFRSRATNERSNRSGLSSRTVGISIPIWA